MAFHHISQIHYEYYETVEPLKSVCANYKDTIHEAHGYFDVKGMKCAREQVQSIYGLRSCDDVAIVHTVAHAFWALINSLCNEGDNYILPKYHSLEMSVYPEERNISSLVYDNLSSIPSLLNSHTKCVILANPCVLTGKFLDEVEFSEILVKINNCPIIIYEHSQYFDMKPRSKIVEMLRVSNIPTFIVEGTGGRYGFKGLSVAWIGFMTPGDELDLIKKSVVAMHSFFLHASTLTQNRLKFLEELYSAHQFELKKFISLKQKNLIEILQKEGFQPTEPDCGCACAQKYCAKEELQKLIEICKTKNFHFELANETYIKIYY